MKKTKKVASPRVSPQVIAANLTKGVGKDRALRIAKNMAKELKTIGIADVNSDIFSADEIKRNEQTWIHVQGILAK